MQELHNHLRKIKLSTTARNGEFISFLSNQSAKGQTQILSWTQHDFSVNTCDWCILVGNKKRTVRDCLNHMWEFQNQGKFMKIYCNFNKESSQLLCISFHNLGHYYTLIFMKTILHTTILNTILDTKNIVKFTLSCNPTEWPVKLTYTVHTNLTYFTKLIRNYQP